MIDRENAERELIEETLRELYQSEISKNSSKKNKLSVPDRLDEIEEKQSNLNSDLDELSNKAAKIESQISKVNNHMIYGGIGIGVVVILALMAMLFDWLYFRHERVVNDIKVDIYENLQSMNPQPTLKLQSVEFR